MAKPILNQSVRVQQSLEALTHRILQLGEQALSLEKQINAYLVQLNQQLDKERHQSKAFSPVYDREKFRQLNERFRSQFNQTLSMLLLDTRLFEESLSSYNCEVALAHINSGVAHG